MIMNWIIGIGSVVIVLLTIKHFITNAKNGKEEGCSGNCSSCRSCGIHHTPKSTHE